MATLLTPLQQALLQAVARTPLRGQFYLTGGTILAECYLQHRYSDDIDFFTDEPDAVRLVGPVMERVAAQLHTTITFPRRSGSSFLECFLADAQGARLELDFALDSPYRLEPLVEMPALGWRVDSRLDITCNKLSAICDRLEPKDFVDLYFLHQQGQGLAEAMPLAQRKHVGLEPYALAQAFARVRHLAMLPRMIKPITLAELQTFFTQQAQQLLSSLR